MDIIVQSDLPLPIEGTGPVTLLMSVTHDVLVISAVGRTLILIL